VKASKKFSKKKVKPSSKAKSSLLERIKNTPQPPWRGPQEEGISQSMLNLYLYCPERFRIYTIEGYQPIREFNRYIFYGDLWHTCEEHLARGEDWEQPLLAEAQKALQQYPESRESIDQFYKLCKMQFPIYLKYWSTEPDVQSRKPIWQERPFNIDYELPSGRSVKIRGKFDSVDIIGKSKTRGIYLQENKTKSEINTNKLIYELPSNLQTNLYLTALELSSRDLFKETDENLAILGVRYNVIKRPLSKGKYCISQSKGRVVNRKDSDGKALKDAEGNTLKTRAGVESEKDFYQRLGGLIEEDPGYFFVRLKCDISSNDLKTFQTEALNPILENLCQDYEWWTWCHQKRISPYSKRRKEVYSKHYPHHYRMPYGIYNPIAEGKVDEYGEYITRGVTSGMERVEPGSFFDHHTT